jgi:hypothetical protein
MRSALISRKPYWEIFTLRWNITSVAQLANRRQGQHLLLLQLQLTLQAQKPRTFLCVVAVAGHLWGVGQAQMLAPVQYTEQELLMVGSLQLAGGQGWKVW